MKTKLLLLVSLVVCVASFFIPVITPGQAGQGEWPCNLEYIVREGQLDLDCLKNTGNCTCTIFIY